MRSITNTRIASIISSPILLYSGLILLCLFTWWAKIRYIDLKIAWEGFSPIGWVYQSANPADYIKNFPGGTEGYGKSAVMHIYTLAYTYLGIAPENLLPLVIGIEIALLAWSLYLLCRTLMPDAPTMVPVIVIIWVIASYARDMNLALFGQPFFVGQFYNVEDFLRILAIVMALKRLYLLSAAFIAAAFITHPTMGIIGLIFLIAMQMARPREILTRRVLIGAALFVLISGGWTFAMFEPVNFSGSAIPDQMWFDLTRLNSFHWYPVEYGLFTTANERFVPFLSFLILFVFYISHHKPLTEKDIKMISGVCAMMVLAIGGILISVLIPNPALIKLSLHRANDLVIIVGLIYVVNGLWNEIQSSRNWRKAMALLVLISPFILRWGFPLIYSILLTLPAWFSVLRGKFSDRKNLLISMLTIGCVLLIGVYVVTGIAYIWTHDVYTGARLFSFIPYYGGAFLAIIVILFGNLFDRKLAHVISISLIIFAAFFWMKQQQPSSDYILKAKHYKQVQTWAREQTKKDALFMVDPSVYYGWRDYSRRSSFGNLREWLYTSWGYNSQFKNYEEGLRRFNEFSINLDEYLNEKPPLAGFFKLSEKVKKTYYSMSDDWRLNLAKRYGIDYFVMDKSEIANASLLPIAYKNPQFIVFAVGHVSAIGALENSASQKNKTIKGMSVKGFQEKDGNWTLTTSGARFVFNKVKRAIMIFQRINEEREIAQLSLSDEAIHLLSEKPEAKSFDYVWKEPGKMDSRVVISGDSVIRFYNLKELEVQFLFQPLHRKAHKSNGGIVAFDESGGLAIMPPESSSMENYKVETDLKAWRLKAKKNIPVLFIGICPPREFDIDRARWVVVHYSSHIQRYPTNEEIIEFSKYARVLEMHQWVWKSHSTSRKGQSKEKYSNSKGSDIPPWDDQSHLPEKNRWIPYNEKEFIRVIETCHKNGMLFAPYFGGDSIDPDAFLQEVRRLKRKYNIDGLYLDGLLSETKKGPFDAYLYAREIRKIFGDAGWLNYHNSHDGYFAPFVQTYMDFITTSEHENFNRWTSTTFNISNAIGGYWPEIPAFWPDTSMNIKDGRAYLKNLVDLSLQYNNRILILVGKSGQWRFWRLYFTPDELEFIKKYYIAKISNN